MDLYGFLSCATSVDDLSRRLNIVKAGSVFGESLCYSQLLAIEGVLEEAQQEQGWDVDDELASVKDGGLVDSSRRNACFLC